MKRGTCIVGIASKGSVMLGADTLVSDQWSKFSMKQSKLVRLTDDVLLGCCGSVRLRDILACDVSPSPAGKSEHDPHRYIVSVVVPEIRDKLKAGGCLGSDNGIEQIDAMMLLAYRGCLFMVDSDLQVSQPAAGYWAVGSGSEYALGSLFSTRGVREPKKRITLALQAASEFSPSVAPPFVYERLDAGS